MSNYGIIIFDASPLITLAKAGELDLLTRQPIPIIIPDAVYREATNPNYDDGVAVVEWVESNSDRVRIATTKAGLQQDILLKAGVKATDLGETAAIEVADRYLAASPQNRVVIVYEDAGVRKRERDPRVDIVTTGAFLSGLEKAGMLQSVDHILDLAHSAGRDVSRQRTGQPVNDPPLQLIDQVRGGRPTGLLDTEISHLGASPARNIDPPGQSQSNIDHPKGRSR